VLVVGGVLSLKERYQRRRYASFGNMQRSAWSSIELEADTNRVDTVEVACSVGRGETNKRLIVVAQQENSPKDQDNLLVFRKNCSWI